MTVTSMDNLVETVRRYRRLSGLSQSKLANLAGVGKTAVFDLEHGKKSMRLETVIKILAVLNIKMLFEPPIVHEVGKNSISPNVTTAPTRSQ
jgi:HTH-type transcriptional regulator/antitoxin HipB